MDSSNLISRIISNDCNASGSPKPFHLAMQRVGQCFIPVASPCFYCISIFQQVALDAQLVTVESLELGGVTGKAGCGIT